MRISTLVIAALLLAGGAASGEPPPCVMDAISGEGARTSAIPAPRVAPAAGDAGTRLRIEGEGFPPGTGVMLAAIYGEGDCTIVGLGDQMLGATRVDPDGTYRIERPWPATFAPLLGRGSFPRTELPDGRYFIVALPCTQPAACTLTDASIPGGPFVQGARVGAPQREPHEDPAPTGLIGAGAGALVIVTGFAVLRRLTS